MSEHWTWWETIRIAVAVMIMPRRARVGLIALTAVTKEVDALWGETRIG